MRFFLFILGFSLSLGACTSESGLHGSSKVDAGIPEILVEPELLDFGAVLRYQESVQTFKVTNIGEGELRVTDITILGETGFILPDPIEDLSFQLPAGAHRDISVIFSPLGPDATSDQAIVTSNDEETPEVAVDLVATGLFPDLVIEPDPYDFNVLFVGCPDVGELNLVNRGRETLTVSELSLESSVFSLITSPTLPLALEPGASSPFSVSYQPSLAVHDQTFITARSDDPSGDTLGELLGAGVYLGDYQDTFEIPEYPSVDLMFVIDQSSSMADDQKSLAANFGLFTTMLSEVDADWQVMVVNYYSGCNSLGILTPSTPDYESTFATAIVTGSWDEWHSGGGVSATGEAGLHVGWAGVQATDPGECNEGFLRPGAWLHIIIVSDEADQSPQTWDWYVNEIIAKKGSASEVRMSAIAGDYPSGCASASAGVGYYEASAATGGEFLSICSDWGSTMSVLADVSVTQGRFELSGTPDTSTLHVFIDSAERLDGWSYDPSANAVTFAEPVPSGGSTVDIEYMGLGACL